MSRRKRRVNDIDVLRVWPGNGCPVEGNWKAPTIIAYQSENPSTSRDHWGYEVRPNMKACSWTKLLLDTSAETAEFDDPSIRDAVGSETFFHLPNGKSPQQVCQDYLTHVYDFVTNKSQVAHDCCYFLRDANGVLPDDARHLDRQGSSRHEGGCDGSWVWLSAL